MITAGLDLGTRSAKAVVLGPDGIMASTVGPIDDVIGKVAKRTLARALKKAETSRRRLDGIGVTGFGRQAARAAYRQFPEVMCLAAALAKLRPDVGFALDLGGLSTRGVCIGKGGAVDDYLENEKCASGSGRFLELVAEALEVELEDVGPLSLTSKAPLALTSQCVVFAESEVINHVNAGEEPADVLAGLHRSIAERVASLAKRLDPEPQITVVGGVAKNPGVVHFLGQALDAAIVEAPEDPVIISALGAAMLVRK